jgi:hypothetical protein
MRVFYFAVNVGKIPILKRGTFSFPNTFLFIAGYLEVVMTGQEV